MDEEETGDEWESLVTEIPEDSLVLGRIEIVRFLTADGHDLILYIAHDGGGSDLPLAEAIGMLRITEDTVFCDRAGYRRRR